MNTKLRKWMPIALCCLPGVAIAVIIGLGIAVGGSTIGASLGGPLGIVLIAVAALACPLSMGLIMMRQRGSGQQSTPYNSAAQMDCCLPEQNEETSTHQLASLRAKREALEHQLAELQAK